MTRPHTDHERLGTVNEMHVLTQWLATAPHTVSHLVAAMWAAADDGLVAARYDGDGGTSVHGGAESSTTERIALRERSDRAAEDAYRMDQILERWRDDIDWVRSRLGYLAQPSNAQRLPGIGDPSPGSCHPHWRAGIQLAAVKNPQRTRCRKCHDHYTAHGEDIPPLVLNAQREHGSWDHPLVLRAWESSGWATDPLRKRAS